MEGVKSVWGSSWYLAATEGHTNLVHGHPNDPENIQKPAMVYISSNTILSIREEENVPLGAITLIWGRLLVAPSATRTYIYVASTWLPSRFRVNLSIKNQNKAMGKKDNTYT